MAERLHVIMPCAKAQNIPRIAPSILQCEGHGFELRWHLCQQGPEADPKGLRKINEALNWIKDGWFHTPSDDTIHYASLYRRTWEIISSNPDTGAIVFSEDRGPKEGNRIMRASPANMKPCEVDGSQIIWSKSFVGDELYPCEQFPLTADGVFTQRMFERDPSKFVFVDEVLVRFNSLDP